MTKKLVGNIYTGVFIFIFVVMVGIMVKGLIDQNKDEKLQTARYEQMISENGRTVLTDEILKEDYDKYVQDSEKSKKTFISLLICFGTVMVATVLLAIFSVVLRGMEDPNGTTLVIALVTFIGVMMILAIAGVTTFNVIVPRLKADNPSSETYAFYEIKYTDSERKEEKVEVKNGDSTSTETRVYYYLIEEGGDEVQVSKLLYERYCGPGVYYVGRTSRGKILSIYPDKYFELSK